MGFVYKVLGQSAPAENTISLVYNVPIGSNAVISTINVANRDATNTSYSLFVKKSEQVLGASNQIIALNIAVLGNDAAALTFGATLGSNDAIFANVIGNASINVFGTELEP